MSLLLDTHVILWWLADDLTLSDEVKTRLDDEPDVYVSPASLWEVTNKQSIGKLSEPIDLAEEIRDSGVRELPGDPFDRMLVAQAQCEGFTLAVATSTSRDTTSLSSRCDPRPRWPAGTCAGAGSRALSVSPIERVGPGPSHCQAQEPA